MLAALRGESGVAPVQPNRIPETGQDGYYEARYAPHRGASGEVTGALGVVRDVTARVRAEPALQTSERDLRRLFELAGDAILVFDPAGEIILDATPTPAPVPSTGSPARSSSAAASSRCPPTRSRRNPIWRRC